MRLGIVKCLLLGMVLGWSSAAHAAEPVADAAATSSKLLRASTLLGIEVRNPQSGETLGTVEDLMVDALDGRVRYVALSFGGFLGLGNKLFAVPWQAVELRQDQGAYFLSLPIPKERLQRAPGFDKSEWPNMGDPRWSTDVDAFYRASRDDAAPQSGEGNQHGCLGFRVSQTKNMTVHGAEQQEIGQVHDLVIDIERGQVHYVAVSFGGLLGFGQKLFAMPPGVFEYERDENGRRLVCNIAKDRLASAPGFDPNHWPPFADARWSQSERHFQPPRDAERASPPDPCDDRPTLKEPVPGNAPASLP